VCIQPSVQDALCCKQHHDRPEQDGTMSCSTSMRVALDHQRTVHNNLTFTRQRNLISQLMRISALSLGDAPCASRRDINTWKMG
jgi:hypothetical protein